MKGQSGFVLTHVREITDGREDLKFIGVYSNHEEAALAASRVAKRPGFCDAVAGIHIQEYLQRSTGSLRSEWRIRNAARELLPCQEHQAAAFETVPRGKSV